MEGYILSFDVGTSGIKAVLVASDGKVGGMETREYPLLQPHQDWAEQRPQDYWNGACSATRTLMEKTGLQPSSIKGIVFATQWKGVIPLDKDGNVLHNSIIWMDRRDAKQAAQLTERNGIKHAVNDYWPRVMWFRDNCPDLFAKTWKITDANGYLKYRACGELAIDMSENFAYSVRPKTQEFFNATLKAAELDKELFPKLVSPSEKVGELTETGASELGLVPGIPVFGGMCDIPAVTIGSGAVRPGDAHLYLGTSGWVGITRNVSDCKGLVPIMFSDDRYCAVAGISAMCAGKDYAIRTFYGGLDYAKVEEEISSVPAGSDGMMCITGFFGEVAAPISQKARGTFVGVTSLHERKHYVNATMEGICYFIRARKEALEASNGVSIKFLNAVGGGTLSPHWMQLFADILGVEVRIPESPKYSGAVGAAYAALIGLGECDGYDGLADSVSITKTYTPDPADSAFQNERYAKWCTLVEAMKVFGTEQGL